MPFFLRHKKLGLAVIALVAALCIGYYVVTQCNTNPKHQVGEVIDTFNGVHVYYNGGFGHVKGRNTSSDGYNLGLKYQCVEFVKRYYYEHFNHQMPDAYGHAKSFFNAELKDGTLNPQRGLRQFTNGSSTKPQESDLLVYGPTVLNRFGHVAIVSQVSDNSIEIVQQNPGPFGASRETYPLVQNADGAWHIGYNRIVGFLRMP